jgi:carboxylate-amine ligase
MNAPSEDFTIGVEEEYQIINPQTRELTQRAGRVLSKARKSLGEEVENELYLSQIEVGTPVCRTLADVRSHLTRLRRTIISAASQNGSAIAAAGTHPFSRWEDQKLTPKERYQGLEEEYQQLSREEVIFGCHVHVGIADRDAAIRVMNRSRPWLAALLALSCNSPFWMRVDTGYASYRTQLFQRFPTVGTPHFLETRAEYDALVDDLTAIGIIQDASNIYWDVRPSMHFETLEFRVADVCATIDEAVMLAGLCRALARTCFTHDQDGAPVPMPRPEVLRAAQWQAARYGLDDNLIDVFTRRPVPAVDQIEAFLTFVRPALEESGEWDEVRSLVDQTFANGNGARRQRTVFERTGRFEDVVDQIVAETKRDAE